MRREIGECRRTFCTPRFLDCSDYGARLLDCVPNETRKNHYSASQDAADLCCDGDEGIRPLEAIKVLLEKNEHQCKPHCLTEIEKNFSIFCEIFEKFSGTFLRIFSAIILFDGCRLQLPFMFTGNRNRNPRLLKFGESRIKNSPRRADSHVSGDTGQPKVSTEVRDDSPLSRLSSRGRSITRIVC